VFKFLHKSTPTHPTAELSRAMVDAGRAAASDVGALHVLERRGTYSDRKVTYFRVFDPAAVASRSVTAAVYTDLDTHPELVRAAGHVERDGTIVLSRAYAPAVASAGLG
jgi:hypothetical protein